MFTDDYIMRQIEGLSGFLSKILFDRSADWPEMADELETAGDGLPLSGRLDALLSEDKINEAENLLFEEIEADPQLEYLAVALAFYARLAEYDDEYLESRDYSHDEIVEGLNDLSAIYLTLE